MFSFSCIDFYSYYYYLENGEDPNERINGYTVMSEIIRCSMCIDKEKINILKILHDYGGVIDASALSHKSVEMIEFVLDNFNVCDIENLPLTLIKSENYEGLKYCIEERGLVHQFSSLLTYKNSCSDIVHNYIKKLHPFLSDSNISNIIHFL
jgi:hypothetical protein